MSSTPPLELGMGVALRRKRIDHVNVRQIFEKVFRSAKRSLRIYDTLAFKAIKSCQGSSFYLNVSFRIKKRTVRGIKLLQTDGFLFTRLFHLIICGVSYGGSASFLRTKNDFLGYSF